MSGMLLLRQPGTNTAPNWRHWFEAKTVAMAAGFCSGAGRALVTKDFWEVFSGATFLLIPSPRAPGTSNCLQHPTRRQQQAVDNEGAARNQCRRLTLPTPKALRAQSSPSHPGHATCEGNAQEMRLAGAKPPDKKHLPAQLPLKAPSFTRLSPFPHAALQPRESVLVRNTKETGIAKIRHPGRHPSWSTPESVLGVAISSPLLPALCHATSLLPITMLEQPAAGRSPALVPGPGEHPQPRHFAKKAIATSARKVRCPEKPSPAGRGRIPSASVPPAVGTTLWRSPPASLWEDVCHHPPKGHMEPMTLSHAGALCPLEADPGLGRCPQLPQP